MKTFKQYLEEKHPEIKEVKGTLGNILTGAAITLAGAGALHHKYIRKPNADQTVSASAKDNDKGEISKKMRKLRSTEKELMSKNMKKA
jgi:hypothetical protein